MPETTRHRGRYQQAVQLFSYSQIILAFACVSPFSSKSSCRWRAWDYKSIFAAYVQQFVIWTFKLALGVAWVGSYGLQSVDRINLLSDPQQKKASATSLPNLDLDGTTHKAHDSGAKQPSESSAQVYELKGLQHNSGKHETPDAVVRVGQKKIRSTS